MPHAESREGVDHCSCACHRSQTVKVEPSDRLVIGAIIAAIVAFAVLKLIRVQGLFGG